MRNVKLALTISGLRKFFVLAAVLALMCLGGVTQAALVDYTVSGWGPTSYPAPTTPPANAPWGTDGYPVDTLELQTYTGSLDLTPGTYTQKINTLLWSIDYTYGGTATDPNVWSDLSFNVNALRNISFASGPSGALSQTGLLEATWDNDYITFYNGTTISFLVQGFKVDVTPLGFSEIPGSNFSGRNPWVQDPTDVMARFDVSAAAPVPVPPTIWLLGSGLLGLVGLRRKFRK